MAAKTSREGVIIMTGTDTHTPVSAAQIWAIVVVDGTGTGTAILRKVDGSGPTIFNYTGDGVNPITKGFNIYGACSTSGGLHVTASNATLYIYVR